MGRRAIIVLSFAALLLAGPSAGAKVYTTSTHVETVPSGATVFHVTPDGETPLGLTPMNKVKLPRGLVTLRFEKDGYKDLVETVEITKKTMSFVFTLSKAIKPAVLELIAAEEFHGAEITVDGKAVGALPASVTVQPGRHQAVVHKDGYQTWERWIDVIEGQKVTFDVVMKVADKAKGALVVTSAPSGAAVRVNGAPRGEAPIVLEGLDPGEYRVDIDLPEHQPWSTTVQVTEGGRAVVEATLVSTRAETGELKVLVDVDGATVFIDGETAGVAPVHRTDVGPGRHLVEVRAPGHISASEEVDVRAGEATVVRLSLKDSTASATGWVRIVANIADARASIDGAEPQPVPLSRDDVTPGTHFVTVEAEGYAPWTKTISVEPGGRIEVVAELHRSGQLEVSTKDGAPAEVFLDGEQIGRTPLKQSIQTGTYTLTIKRADGTIEEVDIAVGTDAPVVVVARFGEGETKRVKHRAMPMSAQPIDKDRGTFDLFLGWPYLLGARINGGVWKDLDIGLTVSWAIDFVDVEGRAKYMFIRSKTFALAGEFTLGGGGGAGERNSFHMKLRALGSMLISERVAVTARVGAMYFSDMTGQTFPPSSTGAPGARKPRQNEGLLLLLGAAVEFRFHKFWNGFVLFDFHGIGNPDRGRQVLENGALGNACSSPSVNDCEDAANPPFTISAGVSLLF